MKLWARIGYSFEVDEEKYRELKKRKDRFGDADLTDEEVEEIVKNGWLDGDSYIPDVVFDDAEEGR